MRILYIDIDSQRPDHFGCYGYSRNTTPNIDTIAAEGLRMTNVYASDAPCLPSRTAFYSGRFGIQTGVVGHGGTAAEPKREGKYRGFRDRFVDHGMALRLAKAGYHTAMISPFGQRHAAHWYYAGFREMHNTGKNGTESAEEVMPVVDKWLNDNAADDNWYLHVNFWDPHTPYRVPLEYGNPFENDPLPEHLDDDALIKRHMEKAGPHSAQDLGMYRDGNPDYCPREAKRIVDRKTMKHWIDGYDTAVRYVDDQVGRIVEQLKAAGVYEDTAIIISADHGENQGELGIYGEHGTADQATCNIPMIIKWPGGVQGAVDRQLHYNLDWAPTLIDLVNANRSGAEPAEHSPLWDGQSYAGAVKSGCGPDAGHEELVISQCCHVCQRSVRWDKWLYMRTYHDGFHLFPQEMLYDLEADPHEQNNVADQHPELCREAAWRLARWHDQQMQKMTLNASDSVDPLWSVMRDGGPMHAIHEPGRSPLPQYLERLETTGRADKAKQLREKYAIFLP